MKLIPELTSAEQKRFTELIELWNADKNSMTTAQLNEYSALRGIIRTRNLALEKVKYFEHIMKVKIEIKDLGNGLCRLELIRPYGGKEEIVTVSFFPDIMELEDVLTDAYLKTYNGAKSLLQSSFTSEAAERSLSRIFEQSKLRFKVLTLLDNMYISIKAEDTERKVKVNTDLYTTVINLLTTLFR